MEEKAHVGIGEYKILSGEGVLESIGLGSCIGVCIWSRNIPVGGLSHVMLPNSVKHCVNSNPYKFADMAIPAMVEDLISEGAAVNSMTAKMFGGAHLFKGVELNIGQENEMACDKILKDLGIRVVVKDCGGTQGRSLWFDVKKGSVVVGRVYGETKIY